MMSTCITGIQLHAARWSQERAVRKNSRNFALFCLFLSGSCQEVHLSFDARGHLLHCVCCVVGLQKYFIPLLNSIGLSP